MRTTNFVLPPTDDTVLQSIAESVALHVPPSTHNVFHDVMSCVIEQQVHYRSTKLVFQYVLQESRISELTPENFPLIERALSTLRLSEAKYETMTHVVDFFSQNEIDWPRLSDEEVTAELMRIKGIGRWTVQMVLLYNLRRPDVFPEGDYHLKKAMRMAYGLADEAGLEKKMLTIAAPWKGFQSLAVLYLLAWKEQSLMKKRKRV